MARYYQSQLVKPISQAYTPTTLSYIDEAGKSMQKQTDDATVAVDEMQKALNIKGGAETQNLAKEVTNKYAPELEALAAELNSTGRISGGIGKVSSAINRLKADQDYQTVMADQAYTESGKPAKIVTDPAFGMHVQDIIDPNTGMYKQRKSGERFDERWYQTVAPGDTFADYQPMFDKMKAKQDEQWDPATYDTVEDKDGNLQTRVRQTGQVVETLTREDVKNKIAGLVREDPNALNKQSRIYAKALHEKQFPGSKYDENDHLEDIANAFMGDIYNRKDLSKESFKTVKDEADGSGKKKKSGSAEEGTDNRSLNIIRQASESGGATTNAQEQAILLNGTYDAKTNKYTINANDRTIYINTAKSATPAEAEKNVQLNKALPLKGKQNDLIEGYNSSINDMPVTKEGAVQDPNSTLKTGTGKDYKEVSYYKSEAGTGEPTYYEYDSQTGKTRAMTASDFKSTDFYKQKIGAMQTNDPEYQALQAEAKRQGIDLDDEELNKNIQANTKNATALNTLNLALKNITGDLEITPAANKNVFADDRGNPLVNGTAFITEEQMQEQIAPNDPWWMGAGGGYKNLEKDGIIKKDKRTIIKEDGSVVQVPGYTIKTSIPVEGQDWENVTRNIDKATWGEVQWNRDQSIANQGEVKTEILKTRINKDVNNFVKSFSKAPDKWMTNWDFEFNQYLDGKAKDADGNAIAPPNISDQDRGELNAHKVAVMEMPSKTPEQKKLKATELYKIKLALTDKDAYKMIFGTQSQTAQGGDGGKPTAQDPLGM